MISTNDFFNAIDKNIEVKEGQAVGRIEAADACYELAKQMAIAFQVHNGMLPEVANYHFEAWSKTK